MNPLKWKIASVCLVAGLFFSCAALAQAAQKRTFIIFHSPSCHACLKARAEILPEMERRFQDRVVFEYRDINDLQNYKFLLSLKKRYHGPEESSLPLFFMSGKFMLGNVHLGRSLDEFITQGLILPFREDKEYSEVDLIARFKTFTPFMIIGAGFIDGFNPCAFTVIVFFISFLTLQGYRRREIAFIGSTFIAAVFCAYVLIGLGLFGFLYSLRGFWLVSRILNYCIGAASVIFGIVTLYDYWRFKKTGSAENFVLQLPQSIKTRIHRIVGEHYRRGADEKQKGGSRSLLRLALSAWICGVLVSVLEAVCTGQAYLPTIGLILKTTTLRAQAFFYLIVYNVMFIFPLLVILVLALSGVSSGGFADFFKRRMGLVKLCLAVFFLCAGAYLLFK